MENRNLGFNMFKGIIVMLMLIVNAPGIWNGHYSPLNYSGDQGCTLADMLMPAFLFAMGGSMWFSMGKYKDQLWEGLLRKILWRTTILFVLGCILSAFPYTEGALSTIKNGFTPLQIIALAYPISAVICLTLPKRYMILTIVLLLGLHWIAFDYAYARLTTGITPQQYPNWNNPQLPYNAMVSYISLLSACIPVLMGWLSGFVLTYREQYLDLAVRDLSAYGLFTLVLGGLWEQGLPFHPSLFSGSYLMYATGASMLLLAAIVWVYEYMKFNFGTGVFNIFGLNPLLALMFAMILSKSLMVTTDTPADTQVSVWQCIYQQIFFKIEAFQFGNLLMGLAFATFVWLFCRIAYFKKFYIKI